MRPATQHALQQTAFTPTLGITVRMSDAPQPSIHPLTRTEWRQWLAANHPRTTGVWLVSYKKATGKPRFEYNDAVEEALCFGWVDSKPNKLDAERTLLWFAPRKSGTGWSRPNKLRVDRRMKAGLMAEAGLRKVEQAKADGSWEKLDAIEELTIPDDLAQALDAYPGRNTELQCVPTLNQAWHSGVDRNRQDAADACQAHR